MCNHRAGHRRRSANGGWRAERLKGIRRTDGETGEKRKRERKEKRRDEREEGIEAVMDLIIVDPRKTRDRSEMLL